MPKGMLVDLTKCMGCRGCQVACKEWNQLPAEPTTWQGSYENPPDLKWNTYTKVRFVEGQDNGNFFWRFVKTQCMHCLEPACVSACLVKALEKLPNGPVIYHENLCMGCRYCMIACPFEIPKFEYNKAIPAIRKCTFCYERLGVGRTSACSHTCPSQAIKFGERAELIEAAKTRIYQNPDKYIHHIYGEHEVGGTSVMYISSISFEKLGFKTNLGTTPIPAFTKTFLSTVPLVIIGGAGLLAGFYWIAKRRDEITKAEVEKK